MRERMGPAKKLIAAAAVVCLGFGPAESGATNLGGDYEKPHGALFGGLLGELDLGGLFGHGSTHGGHGGIPGFPDFNLPELPHPPQSHRPQLPKLTELPNIDHGGLLQHVSGGVFEHLAGLHDLIGSHFGGHHPHPYSPPPPGGGGNPGSPVPEPGTITLLGLAMGKAFHASRKRKLRAA